MSLMPCKWSSQVFYTTCIAFLLLFCKASGYGECVLREHDRRTEAFEILNVFNCTVYLAHMTNNNIHASQFVEWTPSNLWLKNPLGVRYITFAKSCLFGSPYFDSVHSHHISASEPWNERVSWIYMANFCLAPSALGGCFPEPCVLFLPKKGSLKFAEIDKCHHM